MILGYDSFFTPISKSLVQYNNTYASVLGRILCMYPYYYAAIIINYRDHLVIIQSLLEFGTDGQLCSYTYSILIKEYLCKLIIIHNVE